MGRDSTQKNNITSNKTLYIVGGILLVIIAVLISLAIYYGQMNDLSEKSEQLANMVSNETNNQTESASSSIGKSIEEEEAKNNTINTISEKTTNTQTNNTNTSNTTKSTKNTTNSNTKSTSNNTKTNTSTNVSTNSNITNKNAEENTNNNENKSNTSVTNDTVAQDSNETNEKEVIFIKPVDGEIVKEFAKENLTYSETLKEWITHTAIDIKADETTIVKASADGVVKSIKNDPRYGLTIVIEHNEEYQTVYSNLLTSEFVVEGETVTQGQTIGTVGNTSAFEIVDDPHLHFAMIKNSEYVDPTIYLKEQ